MTRTVLLASGFAAVALLSGALGVYLYRSNAREAPPLVAAASAETAATGSVTKPVRARPATEEELGGPIVLAQAKTTEEGTDAGESGEMTPDERIDQAGGIRVTSEHGYWKIICEKPPGALNEQCGMHQSVRDADRKELGLSITMLRPADRQGDLLRIQAPLGILLPTGIGLEIDGEDIGTAFFVRCFADGCWADVNVDQKLLDALKNGKRAIFKVFPSPEEGVGIPVELDGFAEAYGDLS